MAAVTTELDIRPIGAALGAEIHGIKLAELDDETFAAVREAWLEHLVVFFPDQHLSPDDHRAFAQRFGEAEIHQFLPKIDEEHPEIVVLDAERGFVADVWHTDCTFEPNPPICSVLNAMEMPDTGGDTMWSNQHLAYERLAEPMKEMLNGLTAVNSAAAYGQPEVTAVHPVVRIHPETGKPSLFVNKQFTRRIVELSRDESEALLTMLFAHASATPFTCRYSWSPGDVGMWDNRCTQHYAVNDFEGRRAISRVTILGDDPKPAFDTEKWKPYEYHRVSAASHAMDRA